MKSKLRTSAGILLFFACSLASSLAQTPGASAPSQIDPATGMVIPPALEWNAADWKDTNWQDPDILLSNVFYDNFPLSEVAHILSEQFKEQFDVLLPGATSGVAYESGQRVPAAWQNDWRQEQIQLRLKNVTASEVFRAMNLLFENNRTPLRWELKANGHRQIALLRVLVDPVPLNISPPGADLVRRIYFVGDLIGDEKSGGMTMEQITKTITDIWKMADTTGGTIQFHKDAQLLVVSGTPGQINFMEQTLRALREKAELASQSQMKENSAIKSGPSAGQK